MRPPWPYDLFPQELPEGTGCQRCHGPGGDHIQTAMTGTSLDAIRASIVNPAHLEGDVRDSVCMQCHLLPGIAIVGPRRFGRGDYSFRPGELLSDYMVHLDFRERNLPEPERFEINHHGYRLMKSECYTQSEGALTCLTCHDPHVSVYHESRPSDHFRRKCLGCHATDACSETIDARSNTTPQDDCVACHMRKAEPDDQRYTEFTDHWIRAHPRATP